MWLGLEEVYFSIDNVEVFVIQRSTELRKGVSVISDVETSSVWRLQIHGEIGWGSILWAKISKVKSRPIHFVWLAWK